jgi:prepilin-type N-terminal cleavage/methylation domain-containing protein
MRRGGFTLLEIVIVLALAAMILAGAVGTMIYSSDERALKSASSEIESMAKRARTIAILNQTPYALEFREGIVRLLPYAQAGQDEKKSSRRRPADVEAEAADSSQNREYVLEGGLELSILRWNSNKWLPAVKDTFHIWRFDPDGLCEPISLRISLGKSWVEETFHPLTATAQEALSQSEFQ